MSLSLNCLVRGRLRPWLLAMVPQANGSGNTPPTAPQPPNPRLGSSRSARGLFGVGNTLRKLGRYEEALPKYERLCQLSSRMHATGPFINWFAHLPELWLRVHGPQGCLTRMFR